MTKQPKPEDGGETKMNRPALRLKPSPSLTHQQKNLLLAEPITRLAIHKDRLLPEGIGDSLNLQYLALRALDFIMERSAIEGGASANEIVELIASEAINVKPTLTQEQGLKVGQVVHGYLSNRREQYAAFRGEYFDPQRRTLAVHDFRLLTMTSDEGPIRFKLDEGAQTLMLSMLEVPEGFAQEAERIMLGKAIERGRIKEAITLARNARVRSINFHQDIEDKLFDTRRDAGRTVWSTEMLPKLDAARQHLKEQLEHEGTVIDTVLERLSSTDGTERDNLLELQYTIEDCRQRHAALHTRVMSASTEFRKLQAHAFGIRHAPRTPDLDDQILVPLMGVAMKDVIEVSDDICAMFAATRAPKLYDLTIAFNRLTEPVTQRDAPPEEELSDLVPIEHVEPAFSQKQVEAAQTWIKRKIEDRHRLDMADAMDIAEKEGMTPQAQRCVLFVILGWWTPPTDGPFPISASINGQLRHARGIGDNVLLSQNDQR